MGANAAGIAQQVHGIILTILWAGCADVLLIIVKYYKHWQKYLIMHSLFGIINILSVLMILLVLIYDRSYLFNYAGFSGMGLLTQIHFLIGVIFMFIIVGIQILGLSIKFNVEGKTQAPEVIKKRKNIHKIFGYFFYSLSKLQILLGWFIYYGFWTPVTTFFVVYYICFYGAIFFIFQRRYRTQAQNLYITMKQKPTKNQVQYQSLLQMLSNGVSKKKITQEFPDIKYVMFKDKAYDVTQLFHPGGNFIIENVIGEEISRYIIGAYGLQSTKSNAYAHSSYAHKLLQQFYIGQINYSETRLLIPKIGDKINIPINWKLNKAISLTKELKCFYFQSSRYKINPLPSILYLGRHFLLESVKKKFPTRLYTLTLCMSPQHRQFISEIIDFLKNPIEQKKINFIFPKQIDTLPFVIKQYKVGGLSQYLHTLQSGAQIKIEGPFGRGLELQQGTYYAFCGGTGVLPLLDLIYEILQEIYAKVTKSSEKRLPQNFKFVLYLSVNTANDLNGLEIITNTYLLSQKYKLDMFRLFIRVSKGNKIQNVPNYEQRLDLQMLNNIVRSENNLKIAFVCGSPVMNYDVATNLYKLIPKEQVHIL